MKKISFSFYIFSLILSTISIYSQTPLLKWEYSKISSELELGNLHGYNIGVSRQGWIFSSIYNKDKIPMMLFVDQNGKYLFHYIFYKQKFAELIFRIRVDADNIYLNNVEDTFYEYDVFGIQTTWTDSTNTIFYPANLAYSRFIDGPRYNMFIAFNYQKNEYFHSSINSQLKFDIRFIARSEFSSIGDSVYTVVKVGQINQVGVLTRTIDSFLLNSIHKDEFVSMPKPKAMRWQPKYGQWPQYHDGRNQDQNSGQLGMMISADTVIPTSKTITQVRTAQFVGVNGLEKFDQVVDVNPYLVENFAGKRLKWKGFTNSSFGFVALYENIDDNNRNILIRYNSATQTFTTVPLDASVDCRSLCIDSIGALAIVGTKNVSGNHDFYLGYFNSLGELSEQSWGGHEYDRLNDCVFDTLGEIAVSGQKGNDLYLAKFTFNATSVSDKGANSVPSVFIHQGGSLTANNELIVENLPSGNTIIRMYTMQGTLVGTIYEGMILEGATYRFPIPSTSISSGVYLIMLENNGITQTKQFVVVK